MKQPEKWKDTIDPFKINFHNFKLIKVLGYPHARNDVFYCTGESDNKKLNALLNMVAKLTATFHTRLK